MKTLTYLDGGQVQGNMHPGNKIQLAIVSAARKFMGEKA